MANGFWLRSVKIEGRGVGVIMESVRCLPHAALLVLSTSRNLSLGALVGKTPLKLWGWHATQQGNVKDDHHIDDQKRNAVGNWPLLVDHDVKNSMKSAKHSFHFKPIGVRFPTHTARKQKSGGQHLATPTWDERGAAVYGNRRPKTDDRRPRSMSPARCGLKKT